jgi:hypothetical protein
MKKNQTKFQMKRLINRGHDGKQFISKGLASLNNTLVYQFANAITLPGENNTISIDVTNIKKTETIKTYFEFTVTNSSTVTEIEFLSPFSFLENATLVLNKQNDNSQVFQYNRLSHINLAVANYLLQFQDSIASYSHASRECGIYPNATTQTVDKADAAANGNPLIPKSKTCKILLNVLFPMLEFNSFDGVSSIDLNFTFASNLELPFLATRRFNGSTPPEGVTAVHPLKDCKFSKLNINFFQLSYQDESHYIKNDVYRCPFSKFYSSTLNKNNKAITLVDGMELTIKPHSDFSLMHNIKRIYFIFVPNQTTFNTSNPFSHNDCCFDIELSFDNIIILKINHSNRREYVNFCNYNAFGSESMEDVIGLNFSSGLFNPLNTHTQKLYHTCFLDFVNIPFDQKSEYSYSGFSNSISGYEIKISYNKRSDTGVITPTPNNGFAGELEIVAETTECMIMNTQTGIFQIAKTNY